jgi:hypothetical protein
MAAKMTDNLFVESYIMLNMEITFAGVKSWFEMAGSPLDDAMLFKALLFPEKMSCELQAEVTRMIVYRHEDVFFQVNRVWETDDDTIESIRNVYDPVHQLLLRIMNIRSLRGEQNALIDLGIALNKDKLGALPLYNSLHTYFQNNK